MEITHAREPPPRLEGGGAYFYGDVWAFLNDALPPDTVRSTPNPKPQTLSPKPLNRKPRSRKGTTRSGACGLL